MTYQEAIEFLKWCEDYRKWVKCKEQWPKYNEAITTKEKHDTTKNN